jgi:hypothetical protein
VYLFKKITLNALPLDPIWRDDRALSVDQFGKFQYKDLGIAHGDDVSDFCIEWNFINHYPNLLDILDLLPRRFPFPSECRLH